MARTPSRYRDLVTSYEEEMRLFRTPVRRVWFGLLLLLLAVAPWAAMALAGNYLVYLLNLTAIAVIVALGLNLLCGTTGLISLGHGAFVAVGAYTTAVLTARLGLPFWVALPASAALAGLMGVVVGLPALRLKGLYLALATLGFQLITEHVILRWEGLTGGASGMAVPRPVLAGLTLDTDARCWHLTAALAVLLALGLANLKRSRYGRALAAIRDSDVAAEAVGVDLARYKTLAFGISAAYAGLAGSLLAGYLGYVGPDHFGILLSIEYLAMILVGGLGSLLGAVLGAVVITLLPEGVRYLAGALGDAFPRAAVPDLRSLAVGLLLVLVIVFAPEGLAGRWRRLREYWTTWPFDRGSTPA
ncbi:MAG: branched-chain amino acid ABC transporter permease [Candidatus Latescibacterota bacterium]